MCHLMNWFIVSQNTSSLLGHLRPILFVSVLSTSPTKCLLSPINGDILRANTNLLGLIKSLHTNPTSQKNVRQPLNIMLWIPARISPKSSIIYVYIFVMYGLYVLIWSKSAATFISLIYIPFCQSCKMSFFCNTDHFCPTTFTPRKSA